MVTMDNPYPDTSIAIYRDIKEKEVLEWQMK